MEGSDLVSFFPSDIFRFINQEADIMQDKLKGEVFVEFVRVRIYHTLTLVHNRRTK